MSSEMVADRALASAQAAALAGRRAGSARSTLARIWFYRYIYLLMLPGLLYFFIFHYLPMWGVIVAFQDFRPWQGLFASPWVGFDNFTAFFSGPYFWRLLRNTILISVLNLVFVFPAPLILALANPAWAWPNRLADPGFETYSFNSGVGYYVLAANSPWKQMRGPGDVRFDASSWTAPAEMTQQQPLGFSPGTTGFQGLNIGQNSGRILLYQDIVNPSLLSGNPYYEAWDWLGGAGLDNDTGADTKDVVGEMPCSSAAASANGLNADPGWRVP